AAKYNNLNTIEDAYGISLRPLATFALNKYAQDDCSCFIPTQNDADDADKDVELVAKIHKAIAIISFKLEGQIILRNPEFKMEHRLFLDKIDFENKTVCIEGVTYKLKDCNFPTISKKEPYNLSSEEAELIERLKINFLHSEKLQKHIKFLYSKGGMYTIFNNNLLYHGCIPMNAKYEFLSLNIDGKNLSGKELLDYSDKVMRQGYFLPENSPNKQKALYFMWYLWCGSVSPFFGKDKMTTFERYFIDDKKAILEPKNPYYENIDNEELADKILMEFGLNPESAHIINGHVPVARKKGEKPIKAGGKLFVIDGGLSKAYQAKTGIAGYTLIFNSYGMLITSHQPFSTRLQAIEKEQDIHSTTEVVEKTFNRIKVADTDIGVELKEQIEDLEMLLEAYRTGALAENSKK
ncbi:MAG: fructose-bisphosphatase class III, partial [Clostridia bacterium]|nr:fructose-bisphosphatase class III [Clostridia bacterium]